MPSRADRLERDLLAEREAGEEGELAGGVGPLDVASGSASA